MYLCSVEAVLFVGVFAWKFLFIVSCVQYSNFMMSEPNQARKPQSLLQLSSIFKSHKKPLFHKTGRLSSSTKVRRNSWVGFEAITRIINFFNCTIERFAQIDWTITGGSVKNNSISRQTQPEFATLSDVTHSILLNKFGFRAVQHSLY